MKHTIGKQGQQDPGEAFEAEQSFSDLPGDLCFYLEFDLIPVTNLKINSNQNTVNTIIHMR